MSESVVIVGAGHAAGQAAISLRQGGWQGSISIVGEEPYPPYQRPPLSKKFLAGELPLERLYLRPETFYAEHDIDLRLGSRITAIDREAHRLTLGDGGELAYDKLILATGSRVRRLALPGGELTGVHYLRNIDDVLALQEGFEPGARLVIIGAGYIGLEVAAVAVKSGLVVTVLEAADRVMGRVVSPEVSAFYQREHTRAGVRLRLETPPGTRIGGEGRVSSVIEGDGREHRAELVLIGIGVLPVTELAEAAGLDCDNGIVVDEYCRTADPDILAIGDCTNHPNALLGRRLRLESVHNAQEQAKTAARTLLGRLEPYADVPWFWSDQYDLKLQIAGLGDPGCRRVIRGEPGERSFAVFHCGDDGRLVAVEAINSPREFMLGRKLIAAGARLDPAELADSGNDFKALAETALG
ncbi:MAG: pyridine nucleotide-disulfide oxidoreductase [Gammaproteobacteria bacterium]|nr:MAG: pyridine nucleotide-disulfide oxidoreductase [Gammaproteobacteria bacterium]